ncbi:MAG TPA: tRNA lysidine(34) synthetase TilS, partial [Thermoleophilia bacterium]|nr:tRNA lysidine(34) synthetase TilS [Thermoleophilia bacterium]
MRQRALVRASDRVALAVSGGADSVAMAWILRELEVRAAWRLAGLIHVHHGLRGAAADADEAFTRALAARLDLPIHVSKVDVAAQAAAAGRSIEAVAREARYACFEAGAEALSASRVATAHTLDDQAETVLLRLLRGAGARGLSAIRPRRGLYVRPLLDCRRADLRDYLAARGEAFREDESNADLTIPRNRLRHTLLATIGAEWPGGIEALARVAESAASDERFLMRLALALAPGIGLDAAGGVQLQTEVLNAAPAALARRLVRHAIELVGGLPSARDLDEVRRLSRADTSDGALDLHRVRLVRSGRVLRFERRAGALRGRAGAAAFEYALTVPGMVKIRETGATITAS